MWVEDKVQCSLTFFIAVIVLCWPTSFPGSSLFLPCCGGHVFMYTNQICTGKKSRAREKRSRQRKKVAPGKKSRAKGKKVFAKRKKGYIINRLTICTRERHEQGSVTMGGLQIPLPTRLRALSIQQKSPVQIFGIFAGRMERVRPLPRTLGHVLCNTGHAG